MSTIQYTRNTLDIACIALIKKYTQIPIIVDVSHSLGRKDIINQIGQALLALGVDGIMVEVHPKPQYALSDSRQQLNFSEFDCFIKNIRIIGFLRIENIRLCHFINLALTKFGRLEKRG